MPKTHSKLISTIRNFVDLKLVQNNIDKIVKWADTLPMKFNQNKCNVSMHFCSKITQIPFTMKTNVSHWHALEHLWK